MSRQTLLQPVNMIFALGAGLSLWQVLLIWNATIPMAGAAMLGAAAVASLIFHLQLRAHVTPVVAGCTSVGFLGVCCVFLSSGLASSSGMALAFCVAAIGMVASLGAMAFEASQYVPKASVAVSSQSAGERDQSNDDLAGSSFEEQLLMKLGVEKIRDNEIVLQSWTRTVSGDQEQIEGHLSVDFPANQRVVHLHVPFTPAFSGDIQAWCECELGDVTAEVESAHRYGMRVRVRRGGSLIGEMSTIVQFVVMESQSSISDVA